MSHIIIGTGPAGVAAAEKIRSLDDSAAITLIGDEPELPYSRMAIPYYLTQKIDESGTYIRHNEGHFSDLNIDVVQDQVTACDAASNTISLASGKSMAYEHLLLATGSRPLTPPIPGIDHPKVHHCWTLADARAIANGLKPDAPVVLIGAGFIGSIILEALALSGADLTVVEMGDRMVPHMLDPICGTLLQRWTESKGVRVLSGTTVTAIQADGDQLGVEVDGHDTIPAELVICAAGVKPNAAFCEGVIDLEHGGVVVDDHMRSSVDNIYAAGDVAIGKDFSTGYSVMAIQPVAVDHAHVAATNMAGKSSHYHGAVVMNVLDTLGLISTSFGAWEGIEGGDSATLKDEDNYQYLNLQFADDVLVGANTLGFTDHVGVFRGLIQTRMHLGEWKARLQQDPLRFMEAYLAASQAH